ncbi:MAG: hypothetical protein FJY85_12700 [Deltaproteobacteria bacterium]|nr:hypothetical protein [Deltaproteobacteria bacterium]
MAALPMLRVRYEFSGKYEERLVDFEQARDFTYGSHGWRPRVIAEGQAVSSYDDLIRLASRCSGKEVIDVLLYIPILTGG